MKQILKTHDPFTTSLPRLYYFTPMQEFLNQVVEGEKLYDAFRIERLEGEKSIWDPMTKRRLPTFASKKKLVKVKLQDKVGTLKEERLPEADLGLLQHPRWSALR